LDISETLCQISLMKAKSGKRKPRVKQIRKKRPISKLAKRQSVVPLPAAWER
jgi:hypothetical protein